MGAAPTGNLTFGQEIALWKAANTFVEERFFGGMKEWIAVSEDKKAVYAAGIWFTDRMGYPINTTTIDCWRPGKVCTVAWADLDFDVAGIPHWFGVTSEQYEITLFSETKVTAALQRPCGKSTLAIDVKAKTARIVLVPDLLSDVCLSLFPDRRKSEGQKIQTMTLVNPLDASNKFFDARKAEAEKLVYKPSVKILEIWK